MHYIHQFIHLHPLVVVWIGCSLSALLLFYVWCLVRIAATSDSYYERIVEELYQESLIDRAA